MFQWILKHRLISLAILAALAVAGYFIYRNFFGSAETVSYIESEAETGTIVSTISGTGQVSASNQVNLTAKVSSKVTSVGVVSGQAVKAGTVIASFDATDAYKTVRDAEMSLESAQLSMDKLKQPATELEITQAENSLAQAEENKATAEANIKKAYEDAYNAIADAFLDLPTIITGQYDVLYGYSIGTAEASIGSATDNSSALLNSTASEYKDNISTLIDGAKNDYKTARSKYDANFTAYKGTSRFSDQATIEALLEQTLETVKAMAQAAKSESNLLDTWVDDRNNKTWAIFTSVKTLQANSADYISKTGSHSSSLLSVQTSLTNNRTSLASAERTITEKTQTLADLKAGADALDIRAQEISLQQKINALADAKEQYADYAVTAPFDGVIASVDVKKGDEISSGGAVATIITEKKIAEISLNEVDVAKVKVGQKVTITFDAIDDLSIAGQVVEVDTLGTVSSGVASYTVQIAFDEQDERVKSGMTATANIIIDSAVDVLTVPASAVKTGSDGATYVEVLENGALTKKSVTVGLTDDTTTEIIEGLSAGDKIVTQTITSSAKKSSSSSNSGSGEKNSKSSGSILGGMSGGPAGGPPN